MLRLPDKSGVILNLLVAALLLSAQFDSLVHSFEHDPQAPQANYCGACVTDSQLSSVCVDTHTHQALTPGGDRYVAEYDRSFARACRILVHQRGPPPSL